MKGPHANEVPRSKTQNHPHTPVASCENNCNGHGTCLTINHIYDFYTVAASGSYSTWDANHVTMCVCEEGYTGASCEMRTSSYCIFSTCLICLGMCPKGDDPFTSFTDYRTITIATSASGGTLGGEFKFIFNGKYFYFDADASAFDNDACEAAFEALGNVKDVSCSRGVVNGVGGATYTVEFLAFPTFPVDNNIYSHSGNPPLASFQCETDLITSGTSPTCTIADVAGITYPGFFVLC